MPGAGPLGVDWAERYAAAMRHGESQYRDVLDAIDARFGTKSEFTQTGGMNGALVVPLEGGAYILLTDQDDSLDFDRATHRGWYVALYAAYDDVFGGDVLGSAESEDGSTEKAVELVGMVLGSARP